MNPINFPQVNEIHGPPEGMTSEECMDLPVHHAIGEEQEVFISCWELSDEEIKTILETKKLWIWQYGNFVQPIGPSVDFPFEEMQPPTLFESL